MNQYIYVRPRDDGQGWAVDVYDGRRAWAKTHLGERPLNKAEAHRVAHKLRDPKFYGAQEGMGEARVGTMPGSGIPLPHPPGRHVDGLHRRIDALVAIAEAAEELCMVVGERAADGDFNPLPQASLTGAVREEIAPHVFRQWAAAKAALHRAEIGAERS